MPKACRQGELFPAAAAAHGVELVPVHQPGRFGRDRRELFGAQRPQQDVAYRSVAADDVEGVQALGHGPLAHHLAGDEKARAVVGQHGLGPAQHQDFAVDAGIEHFPQTVRRAGLQHGQVGLGDVHGDDVQAVDVLPVGNLVRFAEKGTDEMQAQDGQSLGGHGPGGQDAVEAAGKKGQGLVGLHAAVLRIPGPEGKVRSRVLPASEVAGRQAFCYEDPFAPQHIAGARHYGPQILPESRRLPQ